MQLPAEYQAPQIAPLDQVKVPAGMSVPSPNDYNYTISQPAFHSLPAAEVRNIFLDKNIDNIVLYFLNIFSVWVEVIHSPFSELH